MKSREKGGFVVGRVDCKGTGGNFLGDRNALSLDFSVGYKGVKI